jgi:hypothetical protein
MEEKRYTQQGKSAQELYAENFREKEKSKAETAETKDGVIIRHKPGSPLNEAIPHWPYYRRASEKRWTQDEVDAIVNEELKLQGLSDEEVAKGRADIERKYGLSPGALSKSNPST